MPWIRSRITVASIALCLSLATIVPSYAQIAPGAGLTGVWTAGPGAAGPDTYLGLLESPKAGATVQSGNAVRVSGWAVDDTAAGWSGFDQMQVYDGDRTKDGSKKLADGTVGLNRPDIADELGGGFAKSGFSATIPANTLSDGALNLFVYLHTPNKGWWYRNLSAKVVTPAALQFPSDPVVAFTRPCCGETITSEQFGTTAEYAVAGYAFDRNPVTDPSAPPKGSGNVGVSTVTLYIDKQPGDPGYDPNVNLLGGQSGGPASPPVLPVNPQDVVSGPNAPPCQFKGSLKTCQAANSLTNAYGPEYALSGWVSFWNQRTAQANMFHTLYAVAKSNITGKTSTASVDVYVKQYSDSSPPCATVQLLRHQCAYLSP